MDGTDTEDETRLDGTAEFVTEAPVPDPGRVRMRRETAELPVRREPVVKDALWRKIHARMFRHQRTDAEVYEAIQAAMGAAQAESFGVRLVRPAPCTLTPAGEAVAAAEAEQYPGKVRWYPGKASGHAS